MGGTSTDVCRYDGELEHISETELAGIKYQTDQLDVETVAAGGGSILGFDGQKTTVGPQSAGSYPGPACYGNGGPLTITDANLILGRLFPENMPINFGSSGIKGLNIEVAYRSFKSLTKTINKKTNECYTPEILAEGYIAVANEAMCRVIRKISIAKGYDIRKHTLICFGSAAAQHVCSIAKSLKINKIIIHPLAGILSAYGIAIADKTNRKAMAIMEVLTENLLSHLDDKFNQLESEIYKSQFQNQFDSIRIDRYLDMRPSLARHLSYN
jgi:N-methylhydantoinase A/acetone carboxylase, beta subunit